MSSISLDLAGRAVAYYAYAAASDVTLERSRGFWPGIDVLLRGDPRVRRVIAPALPHGDRWYYVVVWPSHAPDRLDERLAAGADAHPLFAHALLTQPIEIRCPSCGRRYIALNVDGGQLLLGDDMPARLAMHRFVRQCPECGSAIVPVVAIVGPSSNVLP